VIGDGRTPMPAMGTPAGVVVAVCFAAAVSSMARDTPSHRRDCHATRADAMRRAHRGSIAPSLCRRASVVHDHRSRLERFSIAFETPERIDSDRSSWYEM
jgi:hypothetical protein